MLYIYIYQDICRPCIHYHVWEHVIITYLFLPIPTTFLGAAEWERGNKWSCLVIENDFNKHQNLWGHVMNLTSCFHPFIVQTSWTARYFLTPLVGGSTSSEFYLRLPWVSFIVGSSWQHNHSNGDDSGTVIVIVITSVAEMIMLTLMILFKRPTI